MRFAVAAPGTPLTPAAPKPKPTGRSVAALGKFWRGWTSPGVYEVIKAVTADGAWLFERAADGTWAAGHLPTEIVVKTGLGTLPACRAYAGSGKAQKDLVRLQAHQRGEHKTGRDKACPACPAEEDDDG